MSRKKSNPIATGIAVILLAGVYAVFGGGGSDGAKKAATTAAPAAVVESVSATAKAMATARVAVTVKAASQTPTVTPKPETVYIASSKSGVYHRKPTCSGMKNPQEITKDKAEKQGKRPCKRCY